MGLTGRLRLVAPLILTSVYEILVSAHPIELVLLGALLSEDSENDEIKIHARLRESAVSSLDGELVIFRRWTGCSTWIRAR